MSEIIYLKEFSYEIIEDGDSEAVIYFFMAERVEVKPVKNMRIVMIYPNDWSLQMTPWRYIGKGMENTGGGECFLEAFMEIYDESFAKHYIGGYSLGGLMALYAAYTKGVFDGVASVSGSMWYPGALDFFTKNSIDTGIKKAYISLGDKEALTKNPERVKVEENTRIIAGTLERDCDVIFEMNKGGHFTGILARVEKSILALT